MKRAEQIAAQFIEIAQQNIIREYPNHLTHWMDGPEDVLNPKRLHPVFYGCLDWHSAVHNHWLLVYLLKQFPKATFSEKTLELIKQQLDPEKILAECRYFEPRGRLGFERPYGWAWILTLAGELRNAGRLRSEAVALAPLTRLISRRFEDWLKSLHYPIRTGEHNQSAFAMGLAWDWAQKHESPHLQKLLLSTTKKLYLADRNGHLRLEPSAYDFLSPTLAEADLLRRILTPEEFARWLSLFLPEVPHRLDKNWLVPVPMPDSTDYKLAHLPGLNLSRGWMLHSIAAHLPPDDPRRETLFFSARAHGKAGLKLALREDYGSSHWLPTFAVYYHRIQHRQEL